MRADGSRGLREFLITYPRMAVKPARDECLVLEGMFDFSATSEQHACITDTYDLRILIPSKFPQDPPTVFEIGRRIPRNEDHHVNPDGSLCLGARLRLLYELYQQPTVVGFADRCILPYLFNISHKLRFGGVLPLGELSHGIPGELEDCVDLMQLKNIQQVRIAVQRLALREKDANKLPCPCGCERLLGRCRFRRKLRAFRKVASQEWFASFVDEFKNR